MASFEMALPHAKRVKQLGGDGQEELGLDADLWGLHAVVQQAIKDQAAAAAAGPGQEDAAGGEQSVHPARIPNPQGVLQNLRDAKGEVEVLLDLISFVEQQQFLGVAHLPRKASTLEDLTRDRALRLARRREQLRACTARLEAGLGALRSQAEISNRFVGQVADLRRRWRLRRHGGRDGLFFVDLSLPLTPAARKAVGEQPDAQWNLLQDTNGDVCMVDRVGGRPRAIRGPADISAVLAAKQRALSWHAARQLLAQQAQQGVDPDGLAPLLLQLAEAARAECEREAQHLAGAAAAGAAEAAGPAEAAAGPSAMELAAPSPAPALATPPQADGTTAAATAGSWDSMRSSAAGDVAYLVKAPGFPGRFRSKALLLLQGYLQGGPAAAPGAGGGLSVASGRQPPQGPGGKEGMLPELLAWLRHEAASHRVETALRRQVAAHNRRLAPGSGQAPGQSEPLSLQRLESDDEAVVVWQLAAEGCTLPTLVTVCEGAVRLEGSQAGSSAAPNGVENGAEALAGASRAVGRAQMEHLVALALGR